MRGPLKASPESHYIGDQRKEWRIILNANFYNHKSFKVQQTSNISSMAQKTPLFLKDGVEIRSKF